MQLATLTLTNFRACRDTTVTFSPDLTVLVGENASGKTAIIDALRLATFPASGRQTTWFSADRDLARTVALGEPVELAIRYGALSDTEKAVYLAELLETHDDLIYTASFATSPLTPRRSVLTWSVGETMAEDPEPALRRRIAHVYLPPLRDAVRDLDGGDQAQLHDVLRLLLAGDERAEAEFLSTANEALGAVAKHPLSTGARDAVQAYFSRTTPPNREHVIHLNQRQLELRRIARLLRLQLSEKDVPTGDIASSGLGYANLLYISMIVMQLARAKESDLTLLLVEEPEAHLHPQLQLVLLDFLKDQASQSGQASDGLGPTGKIQVVATTHSPILASTVSIDNLVVVARAGGGEWCTRTTNLCSLNLGAAATRKIDRYLNSTRAALVFARSIVLVEGIAEVLLLPALARRHLATLPPSTGRTATDGSIGTSSENDHGGGPTTQHTGLPSETYAERMRRQFTSATIVSVEGVDFEPYLNLLLGGEHARLDRVVVVTDRDHTGAGDVRKDRYEALYAEAVAAGRLIVEVGGTTLEAEMFREPGNEDLLRRAFLALHPGSESHWNKVVKTTQGMEPNERAEAFAQAIRAESPQENLYLDISKGDFAHLVAEAIHAETDSFLVVPAYLSRAIEAAAGLDPKPR